MCYIRYSYRLGQIGGDKGAFVIFHNLYCYK